MLSTDTPANATTDNRAPWDVPGLPFGIQTEDFARVRLRLSSAGEALAGWTCRRPQRRGGARASNQAGYRDVVDYGLIAPLVALVLGIVVGAVVGHLRGNWLLGAILGLMFSPMHAVGQDGLGPMLWVLPLLGLWTLIAATRDGDNSLHGPPLLFYNEPGPNPADGPIQTGSQHNHPTAAGV